MEPAEKKSRFIEIGDDLALVDGPLSAALVSELNEKYAKHKDDKTGIVLETLATDASSLASNWLAAQIQVNASALANKPVTYVYAVDQGGVSATDSFQVADSLTDMTDEDKSKAIVYVQPKPGNAPLNPYYESLVSVANQHKVRIVKSVESLIKALR